MDVMRKHYGNNGAKVEHRLPRRPRKHSSHRTGLHAATLTKVQLMLEGRALNDGAVAKNKATFI